jgi:hypothetical protein
MLQKYKTNQTNGIILMLIKEKDASLRGVFQIAPSLKRQMKYGL